MKRRLPVVGAMVALAVAGFVVQPATPAHAAIPILGDVQAVLGVVNNVKSAYNTLIEYMTDPAKPPSELEQIKTAISQSATDVKNEIDATATGDVLRVCDDVLVGFEDIGQKTGLELENFRDAAVDCVNAARTQIGAQTTPAALDIDGLALNIGAPIALAASAKANDATDVLIDGINDGNRALLAKQQLRPTCGVTPDPGIDVELITRAATGTVPGTGGEAPIPGHGTCYNYRVAAPKLTEGNVLYYPTGPNTGSLTWSVTGDGHEDFCSVVFTCGHAHVDWPSTTRWDFSVAVDHAMAATSYPIAEAALDKLMPLPGPVGQPVSMVAETAANEIFSPIDVFGVQPTGQMVRGILADTSNDDANGSFQHDTFGGWNSFAGPEFLPGSGGPGYTLKSVTSAVTWNGRVQVFALDRAGNLFTRWQTGPADDAHWSPWAHLDGTLSSVTVARNQDGRLQIFGTTPTGTVVTRYQSVNSESEAAGPYRPQGNNIHPALDAWMPWQTINVMGPTIQVSAVTKNGRISLFCILSYGSIYERHQTAANAEQLTTANWTAWAQVTGPTLAGAGIPARSLQAFLNFDAEINLVVTANGSMQFHRLMGITGPWMQVPGSVYGGFGVTKEGGGAGGNEMFAVDRNGNVSYTFSDGIDKSVTGGLSPATWHSWLPITGATLRAYEAGPYQGPVPSPLQPGTGKVTLKWVDESTNEDAFAIFRYTTGGTLVAEAADLPTADKPGTGKTGTFVDTSPNPGAPCYGFIAYDYNGTWGQSSDLVCPT